MSIFFIAVNIPANMQKICQLRAKSIYFLPSATYFWPAVCHYLLSTPGLTQFFPNAFGFTRSPQRLQSNTLGPAGWRPALVTFAHNLQMTALKPAHKHSSVACWYNPGKGKQITYAYIKRKLLSGCWGFGGKVHKWKLYPDLTCNYTDSTRMACVRHSESRWHGTNPVV